MAYEELMNAENSVSDETDVDDLLDELKAEPEETTTDDVSKDAAADDGYTPQYSEISYEEEADSVQQKKKKKRTIYLPIIISAVIVIGALLGYFIFVTFFTTSEEGTWVYQDSEGMTYYYTFDSSAEGNIVTMNVGTVYYYGTYESSVTEESNNLSVTLYAGEVSGEFTYTVDGYKLFGNSVLTLTNGESTLTLKQADRPEVDDLIQVDENHKIDEALIGDWEFSFPEYGIKYSLTFNDDGSMLFNQFDMISYYCVYTVEDSVIKFSFYGDEKIENELEYSFKGSELIFMDANWTKVDPASKDEA